MPMMSDHLTWENFIFLNSCPAYLDLCLCFYFAAVKGFELLSQGIFFVLDLPWQVSSVFPRLFLRSRDFADSKYMLHHAQFNSDILPDSYKRPYLIKVTSDWCFACIHIEPVWKEAVQELEPLGKTSILKCLCLHTVRETSGFPEIF